ncbi:hypothetical protein GH714_042083 [Hevea brasiliensis]|uniref:Tyrosine decarboxylase n=1 Tax=Hevea brasiliensis TaxID=3981 RepID=A0A6A6MS67_HEVBR|nr:hypothetical protein GH714_042083 [Hevea brasiliensis]
MLSRVGKEKIGKLVVYGSDQTHFAFLKAAQIAGIHPENIRAIKTTKATLFALSSDSFSLSVRSDLEAGLIPLFLCTTVGTTATTTVDPLRPLCEVANQYSVWVHVDAAYAGNACICPELIIFLTGSLSTNHELLRNKASDSAQVVDYKDWQIALSRKFLSMKLWLVLRSYGVTNLRNFLRRHVEMAKLFEGYVAEDNRFEIVVPRNFATVCFRIQPGAIAVASGKLHDQDVLANELNRKLLESVNASGCIYLTHAIVGEVYILRFAVGATLTEDRHVIMAWKVVQDHADYAIRQLSLN